MGFFVPVESESGIFHTCKSCYSCTWDCLSHWARARFSLNSRGEIVLAMFYVLLNPAFPHAHCTVKPDSSCVWALLTVRAWLGVFS